MITFIHPSCFWRDFYLYVSPCTDFFLLKSNKLNGTIFNKDFCCLCFILVTATPWWHSDNVTQNTGKIRRGWRWRNTTTQSDNRRTGKMENITTISVGKIGLSCYKYWYEFLHEFLMVGQYIELFQIFTFLCWPKYGLIWCWRGLKWSYININDDCFLCWFFVWFFLTQLVTNSRYSN